MLTPRNNPHLEGQIRPATEADINAIIHLQEMWRKDVGRLPRSAHGDHIHRGDTFIVHHNGQHAGYLVAHCGHDKNTNILQVACHPDLLRSTLGTQLMQAVTTHAVAHQQLTIRLRTRIDLPANQFWPTVGYHFGGQAITRNAKHSRLNCWFKPLETRYHAPSPIHPPPQPTHP